MIGALVMTHGQLAKELVDAMQRIIGEVANIEAISIGWHDEVDEARERIRSAVARLSTDDGLLILTDMFGGTPTNIALTFLEKDRVEVVTGVNLPMLIKLASLSRDENLAALAQKVRAQGQKSIYVASEVLARLQG